MIQGKYKGYGEDSFYSERLQTIHIYLETIVKRNQEQWQRLSESESVFAQADAAVACLEIYSESRMREPSNDSKEFLLYSL
jgi:hypothetical protein